MLKSPRNIWNVAHYLKVFQTMEITLSILCPEVGVSCNEYLHLNLSTT